MIAEIVGDLIHVATDWSEKDVIKQVPGARWSSDAKVWTVRLTWASLTQLRYLFGEKFQLGPLLHQWAWNEYNTRIYPALQLRGLTALEFTPDPTNDHDTRLFAFQVPGREFLVITGDAMLGDEMGTGKTIQAAAALRRMIRLNGWEATFPVFVTCPNSVGDHWVEKLEEWLPEATPYLAAGGLTPVKRRKVIAEAKEDPTAVLIMNIEAVRLFSRLAPFGSIALAKCKACDPHGDPEKIVTPQKCELHPRELNDFPFRTCILDEAHRAQNPRTKQTRAFWAVFHGPTVKRRWGLTGTPIGDNPGNLWAPMHAICPNEYPVKTPFLDRYALQSWNVHGGIDIIGLRPDNREEFYQIFDPRFRRMLKAEVLPWLPPKVRTKRVVQMTPAQRKAYEEIEEHHVTKLDDGSILIAKKSIVAHTRLLQITSSYITVDEATGEVTLSEPSTKLDELMVVLEEAGTEQVAVCAEQRQLLELAYPRLQKAGISYATVTGTDSVEDRKLNRKRFQDGDVRVMLFTYKAGGVGLDFTAASALVRLQRSYAFIDNKQGEDRVHRPGAEKHTSINIIDIITSGTVEVDQLRDLWKKFGRIDEINRDRVRLTQQGLPTTDLDQEEQIINDSWFEGGMTR